MVVSVVGLLILWNVKFDDVIVLDNLEHMLQLSSAAFRLWPRWKKVSFLENSEFSTDYAMLSVQWDRRPGAMPSKENPDNGRRNSETSKFSP